MSQILAPMLIKKAVSTSTLIFLFETCLTSTRLYPPRTAKLQNSFQTPTDDAPILYNFQFQLISPNDYRRFRNYTSKTFVNPKGDLGDESEESEELSDECTDESSLESSSIFLDSTSNESDS